MQFPVHTSLHTISSEPPGTAAHLLRKDPNMLGENLHQRKVHIPTGLCLVWLLLCLIYLDEELPNINSQQPTRFQEESYLSPCHFQTLFQGHFKFDSASNLLDDPQHLVKSVYQFFPLSHNNIKRQNFNDLEVAFINDSKLQSNLTQLPQSFSSQLSCHFLRGTLPDFSL